LEGGATEVGSNEKIFAVIVLCGIIGIIFAIIEQLLFNEGILLDEYITNTITLREVQFGTVLLWELFGIVVAALGK
jgi:hypothetical protein